MQENNTLEEGKIEEENIQDRDTNRFSYPSKPLSQTLPFVEKIYSELGKGLYHSKEDIAKVHGLSYHTIKSTLSAAQHYSLLELKHGTGYKVTELAANIFLWSDQLDKKANINKSLSSPAIYKKILKEYEGRVFPSEQGLINILIKEQDLSETIAKKVAEILFQNLKDFNLLNNSKVLSLNLKKRDSQSDTFVNAEKINNVSVPVEDGKKSVQLDDENDDDVIQLTIPMKNKTKAFLKFPIEYTNEDMDKIARIVQAYKEMATE